VPNLRTFHVSPGISFKLRPSKDTPF
jgi:hypothetical protein